MIQRQRLAEQSDALARDAAGIEPRPRRSAAKRWVWPARPRPWRSRPTSLSQQEGRPGAAGGRGPGQAANLQAQQAELEADQKVAKFQQRDAEQLKRELTRELTNAGGDKRGTDPRLVKLQRGLKQTMGVKVVSPPEINKSSDAAIFTVIARTPPARPATADLVVPSGLRDPTADLATI